MDVVDLLVIVAGVLPVFVFRDLRTSRAAVFVAVLAGVLLLAGGLPQPLQGAVKIAAVWIYAIVFLWFQHLLAGRSAAEAKIDRELRRIDADANAMARAWPADAGQVRAGRESLLRRLDALEPPNHMWARVVALHHTYYGRLLSLPEDESAASGSPDPVSRVELEQVRQDLGSAWEQALRPGKRDGW